MPDQDQHENLVEAANDAINIVFGDRNVSKQKTIESLKDLQDYIQTMLDTLT